MDLPPRHDLPPRTALLATLGAEPQVVTLTLDALLARGVAVNQVVVLHTLDTLEPVRTSLSELRRAFAAGRDHYGADMLLVPHALGSLHGALEDVTTSAELDIAFQSAYTLIRQMKHAGWRLLLCIAGGRKTLSFTVLSVAQILFDQSDSIWHLLSSPELARSRAFHAPSPDMVTLMPMPLHAWQINRTDDTLRVRAFLQQALTPAEREVALLLIREGLSNQELALRLGKSVRTVENQLSRIYTKAERVLGLTTRVDRVVLLSVVGGSTHMD